MIGLFTMARLIEHFFSTGSFCEAIFSEKACVINFQKESLNKETMLTLSFLRTLMDSHHVGDIIFLPLFIFPFLSPVFSYRSFLLALDFFKKRIKLNALRGFITYVRAFFPFPFFCFFSLSLSYLLFSHLTAHQRIPLRAI